MPAVAKKSAKAAASKSEDAVTKPKKQSLKKLQKTAEINAAKKLAKIKTKAVSDKLNRAPAVSRQKAKHGFDPSRLDRGVLLIKNLPKGFYEKQLNKYFAQYGKVTRVRVARSEKTGGCQGHAYVEFQYPDVAKVAAEAMNGYLMFRQRLQTVYIPPAEQNHNYFKQTVKLVRKKNGKVKVVSAAAQRAAEAVAKYNKPVTPEEHVERVERSKYKLQFLEKKLAKAGIKVDLSSQLYEGNPDEKAAAEKKKGDAKKGDKKKGDNKKQKNAKQNGKAKKGDAKQNGNTTIENLLENTIHTSDEEDDDYKPSAKDAAKPQKAAAKQQKQGKKAQKAANKGNANTTLENLLDNTIHTSDEEDDDFEPSENISIVEPKAASKRQKDAKKGKQLKQVGKKGNANSTLDNFLDNTIHTSDEEDDDFEPAQKTVAKPQKVSAKQQKDAKKGKKSNQVGKKEDANSTLENFLENTIHSSDEEDGDFKPAQKKAAKPAKAAAKLPKTAAKRQNETKQVKKQNANSTLDNLLDNTIHTSDDEDGDYEPSAKKAAIAPKVAAKQQKDAKKGKKSKQGGKKEDANSTLENFLENTIHSSDDEDVDFKPSQNKAAKPSKAAIKLQKTAAKASKPVAKPQKPAAKAEKPAAKPQKPAAKAEKPASKPQKAAAKPEKSAAKPQKPAAKPQKPAAKPQKTAVEPKKVAAKPQNAGAKNSKPNKKGPNKKK